MKTTRHVISNGSKTTEKLTREGWVVVAVKPANSTEKKGIFYI